MALVQNLAEFARGSRQISGAPRDLEAEQGLLGAIMFTNSLMDQLADELDPEMFYEGTHSRIFVAMRDLVSVGRSADPVTILHALGNDPGLDQLGGPQYLADLTDKAPNQKIALEYAGIVREMWRRTKLLRLAKALEAGATDGQTADEMMALAEADMQAVELHARGVALVSAAEAADNVIAQYDDPSLAFGVQVGLSPIDDVTGGMMPGELWLMAGRPGQGKAQPLDAKILLRDGEWTTMGAIRVGTQIASEDGLPSEVVAVHERGERQVYRVSFSDGRSAEACADHLWRVSCRHWEAARVMPTSEIVRLLTRKRYQRRLWIDFQRGEWGSSEELPVHPWLLGALLGNGGLSGGTVRITTPSAHVMSKVTELVPAGVFVTRDGPMGYRLVTVRGQPNPLLDSIRALGLHGLKSIEKFIPEAYMVAARPARLLLLQGLMDTDGWVEKSGSKLICLSSARLALDVQTLARSLGFWASMWPKPAPKFSYRGEQRTGHDAWVTAISCQEPIFTEPRKLARCKYSGRRKNPVIFGVAPTRTTDTRCITVSHPTGQYVTNDFVLTHNSALASSAALNVALHGRGPKGEPMGVIEICSEMTTAQMMRRHIADTCFEMFGPDGPTYSAMRRRTLTESQQRMMRDAAGRLRQLDTLKSLYRTGLTVPGIRAICRRQKVAWARKGIRLGMVIIDHVGLVRASAHIRGRTEEQSEVARDAKALGAPEELDCAIVGLVQLSRKVEERDNKRPQLQDLRDSGEWEQSGDGVIGIYRDAYYAAREPEPKRRDDKLLWDERCSSPMIDALLLKVREGQIQTVKLWADMGRNAIRGQQPEQLFARSYSNPFERLLDPDEPLDDGRMFE